MTTSTTSLQTTPPYGAWRQTYSGEGFDRAQSLATLINDADRAAGLPHSQHGSYSKSAFERAERIVRGAQS